MAELTRRPELQYQVPREACPSPIAKLPSVSRQILKDIPRPPNSVKRPDWTRLWSHYPKPVAQGLFDPIRFFHRNCTHVANCISEVNEQTGFLD